MQAALQGHLWIILNLGLNNSCVKQSLRNLLTDGSQNLLSKLTMKQLSYNMAPLLFNISPPFLREKMTYTGYYPRKSFFHCD